MIAVLTIGLVALVVLAAVVGVVDAVRAGTWREVARERREGWEQRRHDALLAATRNRFPGS